MRAPTAGRASPIVEMMISSTLDPSLAPPGKHVASLFVQHVAPHLPDGRSWSDTNEKAAFADLVIETVSRHAPNFKAAVLAPAGAFAARSRNRFWSHRRRYLPRPTRARSALFGAPGSGLRKLPDAGQRAVSLRLGRASGRRRHRRSRHERGARDSEGSETSQSTMVRVR